MLHIAVINEATTLPDAEVRAMIPALETQWNRDLAPTWSLEAARFAWVPAGSTPRAGSWWVTFLDDSDQAGALAYHDVTDHGLPLSKIFARSVAADKGSVSVAASHEVCEMAVDPTINLAAQDSAGAFWAYEVCDPVEDERYGYDVRGVLMSDFVTPAWFGFPHTTGSVDFGHHATRPFAVLAGGYAQKFDHGGWVQVDGHAVTKDRAKSPAVGSRRRRRATPRGQWRPSAPR